MTAAQPYRCKCGLSTWRAEIGGPHLLVLVCDECSERHYFMLDKVQEPLVCAPQED